MSKTDKTTPWWVQAEWYEPLHRHGCEHQPYHWRWTRYTPWDGKPCDLPSEPVIRDCGPHPTRLNWRKQTECRWEADQPDAYSLPGRKLFAIHPPHWLVRHVWNGPERVRERKLNDVIKDYRANGEVDDFDFANYQHRHGGTWDWS